MMMSKENQIRTYKIGSIVFFKEKAGIVGPDEQWVLFHKEYMYLGNTFFEMFKLFILEHKNDKHLIG